MNILKLLLLLVAAMVSIAGFRTVISAMFLHRRFR